MRKYLKIIETIAEKTLFIVLLLIVTLCQNSAAGNSTPQYGKRPNIIYIMADDHASHAIGAYGSKICETPNIDRLAKEGMRFTNCFNVNSLCAPSRAALITGRYNSHNGFFRNRDKFDGSQLTFPKLLQKAGYKTSLIGKWHLGTEPTGFDYYSVLDGQGQYFNSKFKTSGKKWNETEIVKGYVTDVITDKAIDWLKKCDQSKPFCLMVHHKAPHGPYVYPEKYEKLLPDTKLTLPDNFHCDYKDRGDALAKTRGRWSKLDYVIAGHFNKKVPKGIEKGTKEYKEWAYQNIFNGYRRLVACLDENIGRLLDYLDKSGLSENTLVVYTSDNGFFLGDFGLFNKMWMYEESLRLPLMVRYPGKVKASAVNDQFVSILDFGPTFLDFAGAGVNEEFQGRSIKPLLKSKVPSDWRKAHYYHYYGQYDVPSHYGVRTREYKLIHFYEIEGEDGWELFDLKNAPKEAKNIYSLQDKSQIVKKMKNLLKELRREYENGDR